MTDVHYHDDDDDETGEHLDIDLDTSEVAKSSKLDDIPQGKWVAIVSGKFKNLWGIAGVTKRASMEILCLGKKKGTSTKESTLGKVISTLRKCVTKMDESDIPKNLSSTTDKLQSFTDQDLIK